MIPFRADRIFCSLASSFGFPLWLWLCEGRSKLLPEVVQIPGPTAVRGVHVVDQDEAETDEVEQEDGRDVGDGGGPRIGVDLVQLLDVVRRHVLVQLQTQLVHDRK